MKIVVVLRSVYGAVKAYPGCEVAAKFAALLGTKTLTAAAIAGIAALGYEIEAVGGYELAEAV